MRCGIWYGVYRQLVPSPTQVSAPQIRLCTIATPCVAKRSTRIGKHDVVVDQGRAVADLHEDILRHHAALQWLRKRRALVVMQQILR